ncbi:MAG: DUF6115 domain-containing protein [Candidatus Hydrogenedentota bacterium]
MTLQQLIMWASLGVGATSAVCFLLLVMLYTAKERRTRNERAEADTDKAEVTILFQTMRDVVKQQKDLARQFNSDLDAKMEVIKKILSQSLERNKGLYDEQRSLAAELEAAKAQVFTMQKQMAYLREETERLRNAQPPAPYPTAAAWPESAAAGGADAHGNTGRAKPANSAPDEEALGFIVPEEPQHAHEPHPAPTAAPVPKAGNVVGGKQRERRPKAGEVRVQHLEMLENTGLIAVKNPEKWVGDQLDNARAPKKKHEPPPELAPENRETTRQALRTLANQESGEAQEGNNGSGSLGPVQQRVVEYRDAGMTEAQIAQELGIGKGEVRLMLSLAHQNNKYR